MARPQKPYTPSWPGALPIPGLYKCPDGRWRILQRDGTGKVTRDVKFTEPDEGRAIARFKKWEQEQGIGVVVIPANVDGKQVSAESAEVVAEAVEDAPRFGIVPTVKVSPEYNIPEHIFYPFVRDLILNHTADLAARIGVPELAGLKHFSIPKDALPITTIVDTFKAHNPGTDKSKSEALSTFNACVQFCGASTLDDLTTEKLLAFKTSVESNNNLKSAGTKRAYFGRIKRVIGFGHKAGLDQSQIRAALDRAKVLWTAEPLPSVDPQPISKEHFHKLLTAGNGQWRAFLLLALNLCCTMEDLCELRWSDFDLNKGTYAEIRQKTRRKHIPRIACLWPETLAVLKALPMRSEYVFTSPTGTRYNKNTKVNDFADLRVKAGVPDSVKFNNLRDGAYTVACNGSSDARLPQLLAGHSAGMKDHYVLRNPELVRDICNKVRDYYGPFPVASTGNKPPKQIIQTVDA